MTAPRTETCAQGDTGRHAAPGRDPTARSPCERRADGPVSANHRDVPPPRPACARRTASAPKARWGCGRCTRENDRPTRARLRSDTDVPRWIVRIVARRWSRCGRERSSVAGAASIVTRRRAGIKRSAPRRRAHIRDRDDLQSRSVRKKIFLVGPSTRYPPNINSFSTASHWYDRRSQPPPENAVRSVPSLDGSPIAHYA